MSKLSFDKKIAPIVLDIRFGDKFILRDRFDWDLMELRLRPIDFATAMCNQLPFFKSEEEKQTAIQKMTNSILDQIQAHIDKNTFFPRVRFCRKEEEIIQNDQVCVNCDSILNNPDICIHCGFLYERKPGPQGDKTANLAAQMAAASSNNLTSNADNLKKSGPSQSFIKQQSSLNQNQASMTSINPSESMGKIDESQIFQAPMNKQYLNAGDQLNHESTEPIQTWKQRIDTDYTFSGREKKVCKKCGEVNPFFKNECKICSYKFPKTRGLTSSLNSDNYTLYFWDILHSDPLFSSLGKINDYLEECDFMSVRDLYKKVKEVLSQPNTERIFDITDTQLLELHDSIDEKFELLLTDNDLTDRIFNDAIAQKTNRKRNRQVYYNFRDAQNIHDKKINGNEMEETSNTEDPYKRRKLISEAGIKLKHRQHNFESSKMHTIIHNYNLLSQMGFLDQQVLQSEEINKLVAEKEANIQSTKKRGRPKKFDLTYEDMLKQFIPPQLNVVLTIGMTQNQYSNQVYLGYKEHKMKMEMKITSQSTRKEILMGMLMCAEYVIIQAS